MNKQIPPDEAFIAYVTAAEIAGTERGACATVAKQFDVPRSTITRMAARYRWSARLAGEVAPIVREKTNEIAATSAAEWRRVQSEAGTELLRRGMEAIARMPIESVRDALSAIKQANDMVTKSTEPTTKQVAVDVRHVLTERFQKLVQQPAQAPAPRPQITVDFGDLDDDIAPEGNDQ